MGDSHKPKHHKSGYYSAHAGQNIPLEYLQYGPQRAGTPGGLGVQQYEMSRLHSEANLPLLATRSTASLLPGTTNGSAHSLHERSPSVGPNEAYGSSTMLNHSPSGYFGSQGQHPQHPQQRSASSMGYHSRPGSAGFDQTVAAATGYPPQHQQQQQQQQQQPYYDNRQQYYDQQQQQQQPYYDNRTRTPPMQQAPRAGSAMGYNHQHNPSLGQVYPSMGSNGRNTPTGYPAAGSNGRNTPTGYYGAPPGGDNNTAGRGAYRQNY